MSADQKIIIFLELVKSVQIDSAIVLYLIRVTGYDQIYRYVPDLEFHRSISAHYHHAESEIYYIVRREGIIHTGILSSDEIVAGNTRVEVRNGDCYAFEEGEVQQWENTGPLPMIAITVSPAAHSGHNRFIVKGAIPY
jgi:mannose-6-phosphate isomerase-like protein (cupin superfamily)